LQPTDTKNPDYFHKVVDCQWACPAHTPVPEYIRMIAAGRYGDAYLVNWESNVFPGILGRTCDRPCEPACRRGRVEDENLAKPEPVAICRLKRVAADLKNEDEIKEKINQNRKTSSNGKKIRTRHCSCHRSRRRRSRSSARSSSRRGSDCARSSSSCAPTSTGSARASSS